MELEEFSRLAQSGELTLGQALDFVIDAPKTGRDVKGFRSAIAAGKLAGVDLDTPVKDAFASDEFLSSIETPEANRFRGIQQFEGALKRAAVRGKFNYLNAFELSDDLTTPTGIIKTGGYSEGQLRGTRPMEALIPSRQLDEAYRDAFQAMGNNVDADTKAFLFFHKHSIVRVDTTLGSAKYDPLTLDDIVISEDVDTKERVVTIKGVQREKKKRNSVTYRGAMAEFLADQVNKTKAQNKGKKLSEIKLFNTNTDKVRKAHNTYIKPIVEERFPTSIPVDTKTGKASWTLTAVRSAVQDQLAKEFRIDPGLQDDFASHSVGGTQRAYLSASADGAEIGQISESLLAQNAKNIGAPDVNALINSGYKMGISVFEAGSVTYPALQEDYRGQAAPPPPREATEAEKAQRDQAARTQTAEDALKEQEALRKIGDMPPLDKEKLRKNLEVAEEIAEEKKKIKAEKAAQKATEQAGEFQNTLDFIMKKFGRPPTKLESQIFAGVATVAGVAGDLFTRATPGLTVMAPGMMETRELLPPDLPQTPGDLFSMPREEQSLETAYPEGYTPGTPTQIGETAFRTAEAMVSPAQILPSPTEERGGQQRGFSFADIPQYIRENVGQDSGTFAFDSETTPTPPKSFLEAGGAEQRVNQARTAAMQGQVTTMAESFLYGGTVR
jgi:hypothetical protein